MNIHITRFILVSALTMLSGLAMAAADSDSNNNYIQAFHQWQSTVKTDNGLFDITWSFILTNQNSNDLNNLNLQMHSPSIPHVGEQPSLSITTLTAGASQTVSFIISSPLPVQADFPVKPILLFGQALIEGETVNLSVLSDGGSN